MRAVLDLVAVLSIGLVIAAPAEHYPAKAIRLVVPFAPGGPNDISARIIADELAEAVQQTVVVDNRPGAGGNIGAEAAARSAPDGHALFWAQAATHGINPSLYRKLAYDAVRDFTPVGLIVSEPLVLVTGADLPWRDVKDLIAAAKADPAAIHFGSGGIGTTPHMAAELFAMMAGIRLTHVPYRGNAPAVAMSSRVAFSSCSTASTPRSAISGPARCGCSRSPAASGRRRFRTSQPSPRRSPATRCGAGAGSLRRPERPPRSFDSSVARTRRDRREGAVQRRFAELGAHSR